MPNCLLQCNGLVPCFVIVDLPVRKVFLLQAVHRIAEWLCLKSAILRGRTFLVWGVFVLFVSHFLKSIILRRMRSHQRPSFLRCRHCYYVSLSPSNSSGSLDFSLYFGWRSMHFKAAMFLRSGCSVCRFLQRVLWAGSEVVATVSSSACKFTDEHAAALSG